MKIKKFPLQVKDKNFTVSYLKTFDSNTYRDSKADILEFSKAKLGDFQSINNYSSKMAQMVKEKISDPKDWLVLNNPSSMKNTAYCIAKQLANEIGGTFQKGLNIKKIPSSKYYTKMNLKEKEEVMRQTLFYKGPFIKSQKIILIDDCITTGTILKSCIEKLLEQKVEKIECFVYAKISSTKNEDLFGKAILHENGLDSLIKILQEGKNPLVTRLIGVLFELPVSEIIVIINSIQNKRKEELLKKMIFKVKKRSSLKAKMVEIQKNL